MKKYFRGKMIYSSLPDDETLNLAFKMYESTGRTLIWSAPNYGNDGTVQFETWVSCPLEGRDLRRLLKDPARIELGESDDALEDKSSEDPNISELATMFECEVDIEEYQPSVLDIDGLQFAQLQSKKRLMGKMREIANVSRTIKVRIPPQKFDSSKLKDLPCCKGFLESLTSAVKREKAKGSFPQNFVITHNDDVRPEPFVELLYRLLNNCGAITLSHVVTTKSASLEELSLPFFEQVNYTPILTLFTDKPREESLGQLPKTRSIRVFVAKEVWESTLIEDLKRSYTSIDFSNVGIIDLGTVDSAFIDSLPQLYNALDMPTHNLPEREEALLDKDPFKELDSLIGLESVKEQVREYAALVESRGRQTLPTLHMAFLGNPGTGKTTVARIIASIFDTIGVNKIPGRFIETDSTGLIGLYVGHTGAKTRRLIEQAQGGLLFIDEAYALSGKEKLGSYGEEALASLVKGMEDYRDDFVCILAGYTDEMEDMISVNPGLRNRIGITIEFPDYSAEELLQIFIKFARDKKYYVHPSTHPLLLEKLTRIVGRKDTHFSNARIVRKIFERTTLKQALRTKSNVITKAYIFETFAEQDLAKLVSAPPDRSIGFSKIL